MTVATANLTSAVGSTESSLDPIPPVESFYALIQQQATYCWRKLCTYQRETDFDDIYAEGLLVYARTRTKYNPTKGAKFITYFTFCLKNHYGKLLAKSYKSPHMASLDGPMWWDSNVPLSDTFAEEPHPAVTLSREDLPRHIGRDAWKWAKELAEGSQLFEAWEAENYANQSHSPVIRSYRVFRFLGFNKTQREAIIREMERCLVE